MTQGEDELYMYNKRMADDNGYYGKKQRMKDLYADLENDDEEELYYTKKYRYVEKVTGDLYEEDEDDNRGRRHKEKVEVGSY